MADSIAITPEAYALLVLHAARHPHATVTGFLLGSASSGTTTVSKVVPLAHHWTNLATIEDAGLGLVSRIRALEGRFWVGTYQPVEHPPKITPLTWNTPLVWDRSASPFYQLQKSIEGSVDGLSLLGVYEAPSRANASEPSVSALRLAGKVAQATKAAKGKGKSAQDGSLLFLVSSDRLPIPRLLLLR